MNQDSLLTKLRLSFPAFWTARNSRERSMISAAALVVTLGMVYSLLIDPALSGREQLSKNLPILRQQVAQMQALSKEAAALSEKPAIPLVEMSSQNIEAALERNGLKSQSVVLTGDFAKVQLASVSFAGTLNWLDDMQKTARLSVVEANIVAQSQPETVNATFTLRQPAHE